MSTITLKVEGMSCDHCVRAITTAVTAADAAAAVAVDLHAGTVRAETALAPEALAAAIAAEGYRVVGTVGG